MHKAPMRTRDDTKCARRHCHPGSVAISADRDGALDLARDLGAAGLRVALSWQVVRTLFRIGFSGSLAVLTGRLIEDGTFGSIALADALASLVGLSIAGLFADLSAARAEDGVVNRLRTTLKEALLRKSPARIRTKPAGALVAGLQRYPNALASLVIGHSAAKYMLGIGPLLAATAVAFVSWQAALMLFLAIPVMVAFFIMLGSLVQSRAELQEKAFGRLAAQFADRIRSLPTILANHALRREHGKIEQRMTVYADSTMGVLMVAFLNAGIIDFFSALSIALLAVFLGLGHLGLVHFPGFSGLGLWQSLFILIIAAEFFTPFRRYAEQYHVKAEGQAAARELDWYLNDSDPVIWAIGNVVAKRLILVEAFDATDLPSVGLIAISGPSGSGKSTLLRVLAGIQTPFGGLSPLPQVLTGSCDWISTDIYVPAGTLAETIGWNRDARDRARLREAASRVGLLDEKLLPGGLDACIAPGGDNLSGGQRMRIGIARMILSSGVVFADEPTAKLDSRTAKLIRQVLTDAAKRRLVIVATHDQQLIEAASQHFSLRSQPQSEQAAA
jgi:ABC-type transport system involved in cytochrome bd biosynthesis fused ATPase/permease subunit